MLSCDDICWFNVIQGHSRRKQKKRESLLGSRDNLYTSKVTDNWATFPAFFVHKDILKN